MVLFYARPPVHQILHIVSKLHRNHSQIHMMNDIPLKTVATVIVFVKQISANLLFNSLIKLYHSDSISTCILYTFIFSQHQDYICVLIYQYNTSIMCIIPNYTRWQS